MTDPVIAGLVPTVRSFIKDVDARNESGHDAAG